MRPMERSLLRYRSSLSSTEVERMCEWRDGVRQREAGDECVGRLVGVGATAAVYEAGAGVAKCALRFDDRFREDAALCWLLGEHCIGPRVTSAYLVDDDARVGRDSLCARVLRDVGVEAELDHAGTRVEGRRLLGVGVLHMDRYDGDVVDFFRTHTADAGRALGERLAEKIDRLYDLGVVCADAKPQNALYRWERGELDVRLADFDTRNCCSLHGWCAVPRCAALEDLELAKLATKMQYSWTTYLLSERRPLILKAEAVEFFRRAYDPEFRTYDAVVNSLRGDAALGPLDTLGYYTADGGKSLTARIDEFVDRLLDGRRSKKRRAAALLRDLSPQLPRRRPV